MPISETDLSAFTNPPLLEAQNASLERGERIATLDLTDVTGKAGLDVAGSLTAARVTLTIEGASTLELDIFDPGWEIEQSGLLDKDQNGRLDTVAMTLDSLRWRLAKAARSDGETLTLTFEDEVWALLRAHRTHIASSRGSMTRAQFIERMVREIRLRKVPYYAPERGRKQPVEKPDLPNARPARDSTGFDKGARFTIKGNTASPQQMREVATAMTVADQLDVPQDGIVRLAMLVAGIGESSFIAQMNQGGSPYGGVFQANIRGGVFKLNDTQGMARCFLKGGKGFQAGGAIAAHRSNPGWSPGEIALNVEGSTSNFPSYAAGVHFYQQHHDEAVKIASLWNGGGAGSSSTHEAVRVKAYRFTRGLPGQPENSAQCATRLADEVAWRFFVSGGLVYFVDDPYLLSRKALLSLTGPDAPGLMARPSYEWDHRKKAANVTLSVAANAWQVPPGDVVVCHDMGPVTGRWIVETFEFDLLNPLAATITLVQPVKPKPEPAPDVFTVTVDSKGNTVHDDGIDSPGAPSNNKSVGGYVFPMGKGLTWGRTDMGVDFGGKGAIYAIGKAKLTRVASQGSGTGWPGAGGGRTGAMIVYELLEGSRKNKHVYLAENVDPVAGLHVGQQLEAGQVYAHARGAYPFLEIGWSDAIGQPLAHTYYTEGMQTREGKDFRAFLQRLQAGSR
jgi:hypothetical protein